MFYLHKKIATLSILVLTAGFFLAKPSFALENRTYPQKIRVLEIRFFPAGNDFLYHPDTLSAQLQTMIRDASKFHGYTNSSAIPSTEVEIVQVINHQSKRPSGGGDWEESYKQILQQDNVCETIKNQNIDQLWVWADPRAGYDESPGQEYVISSNFFRNSVQPVTIPSEPFCNGERGFVFFEFDFSRTADLALHSYGHYLEGLIGNLQSGELFWKQYSGETSGSFPRSERCGNVHFPPNGRYGYDYGNTAYVRTSCENWNPAVSGTKTRMNCNRWGCSQEGYLKWWMQNMPNQGNTLTYQGKKLPNWFDFTANLDNAISSYDTDNTYYLNEAFMNLNTQPVAPPAQIGLTTTAKQNSGTTLSLDHTINGENLLLIVSASYRAATNPTAHIQTLSFGGQNMNFIRRDAHADRTTEMWYLQNPTAGAGTLTAVWDANPEDQVLAATTVSGVDIADPIVRSAGAGSNIQDGANPGTQSLTIASGQNEIVLGVLSTYPDGGSNIASAQNNTAQVWNVRTANNNIASQGAAKPGGADTVTLDFASPKNWSWAMSAVSIRLIPIPAVALTVATDKSSYIAGQDTSATVTVDVKDEHGIAISGLLPGAFATLLDSSAQTATFSETTTPGTYTSSLDLTTVQTGAHSLQISVTDTRSLTGTKSTSFSVSDPQQQATTAKVQNIIYRTEGGKNNNKNLVITVKVINNLDASVSGASVSINLLRTGNTVFSSAGTTDSNGEVSYTYSNAAAACYQTTVTAVIANQLTWDNITPSNQFCKQ